VLWGIAHADIFQLKVLLFVPFIPLGGLLLLRDSKLFKVCLLLRVSAVEALGEPYVRRLL
jgi:hypothetical protein